MEEYPNWKEEWKLLVHPNVDAVTELLQMKEVVPKEARVELKLAKTLEELRKWLNREYGQTNKLAANQISKLHAFQAPKSPTTIGKSSRLST